MSKLKPILVGLVNPYSVYPANALAPYPERSAGHRLWKMLANVPVDDLRICPLALKASYNRRDYMDAFDRRNLFIGEVPKRLAHRQRGTRAFVDTVPLGATVIMLGTEVSDNISAVLTGTVSRLFIHPQVVDGVTWRLLPHPSGRSTVYNDPVIRTLAGLLLADVLTAAQGVTTDASQ